MVNLRLHSWHKHIRYNKRDKIQQIWKPFVTHDLSSCFFPSRWTEEEKVAEEEVGFACKRENQRQRYAKSFEHTLSSLSVCLSQPVRQSQSVASAPQAGEQRGYKNTFCLPGLWQFIFSLSAGTPCKGPGSEKQPLFWNRILVKEAQLQKGARRLFLTNLWSRLQKKSQGKVKNKQIVA